MAFTAPQEVAVVAVANRVVPAMPKRTSLPSMLPPDAPPRGPETAWATGSALQAGVAALFRPGAGADSASTNRMVMAARMAQPWRRSRTMRAEGVAERRRESAGSPGSAAKLVSGVGFSKGAPSWR